MVASGWPEPVKQKVRRHKGGSGDKRVGSVEASLQRPSRGPPRSPPLCHSVAESRLASMEWLASGGPLEDRWCCLCGKTPHSIAMQFDCVCMFVCVYVCVCVCMCVCFSLCVGGLHCVAISLYQWTAVCGR